MKTKNQKILMPIEFMEANRLGILKLPSYEQPTIKVGGLFFPESDLKLSRKHCYVILKRLQKQLLKFKDENDNNLVPSDVLGIIVFGSTVNPEKIKNGSNIYGDIDIMIITRKAYNGFGYIARTQSIDMTTGVTQISSGELPVSIDNRSYNQSIHGIESGEDTIMTNALKHGVIICATQPIYNLIEKFHIEQDSPYRVYCNKNIFGTLCNGDLNESGQKEWLSPGL